MTEREQHKAVRLASAIIKLREQDRAVENVWLSLCGRAVEESDRLYSLGVDMPADEILKEIRSKINEALEK